LQRHERGKGGREGNLFVRATRRRSKPEGLGKGDPQREVQPYDQLRRKKMGGEDKNEKWKKKTHSTKGLIKEKKKTHKKGGEGGSVEGVGARKNKMNASMSKGGG